MIKNIKFSFHKKLFKSSLSQFVLRLKNLHLSYSTQYVSTVQQLRLVKSIACILTVQFVVLFMFRETIDKVQKLSVRGQYVF